MSRLPSLDKISSIVEEVAANEIMPRFKCLDENEIAWKSKGDPVTQADICTEKILRKALQDIIPGSLVVGEEGEGKSLGNRDDEYVWLIDPVDGTRNFVHGSDNFCSMIALVRRGQTILSVIHAPARSVTAVAELGSGAYYGGQKLQLAYAYDDEVSLFKGSKVELLDQDLIGQFNFIIIPEAHRDAFCQKLHKRFGKIDRLRCAGLDMVDQARGKRHFSVYKKLWSWDHAPGLLLLTEAGGVHTVLKGCTAYNPLARVYGIVSAVNSKLLHKICAMTEQYDIEIK